jgi:hypothetical protein
MSAKTQAYNATYVNISGGQNASLRHWAALLLTVGIVMVIVWANSEGKKKVWRKEHVATALALTAGALAVFNTPFVNYVNDLLRSIPLVGNFVSIGGDGGMLTSHVLHAAVFFLVAISILYWSKKWLWPRIDDDEHKDYTMTPAHMNRPWKPVY